MNIVTRLFGEIGVDINKVIHFPSGIIGFEKYKQFMIIHDAEATATNIVWLQSLDEPDLALPVINPLLVKPDYNPVVEDELLKPLGNPADEDLVFLLALTVPADMTKVTANMKAPFIINAVERKGVQLIVDNADYPVKFNVYESVQKMKEKAGE